MKKIILIGLVGVVGLAGCQQRPADAVLLEEQPAIFPDYNGVTVPAGIAPLNFNVVDEGVDLVGRTDCHRLWAQGWEMDTIQRL